MDIRCAVVPINRSDITFEAGISQFSEFMRN